MNLKNWGWHLYCFPGGSVVKNPPANTGDTGLIPGQGRSSGEGNGNPLQYSCLGNPMDRGAWCAAVYGVTRVGHNWVTKQHSVVRACVRACVCVSTPEPKNWVLDLGQDPSCLNKSEFSVDAFVDYTSFASVVISVASFVQCVYWTPSKFTIILQLQCGKQSCTQCDFFPFELAVGKKKAMG